jgi:TolA-binding protein
VIVRRLLPPLLALLLGVSCAFLVACGGGNTAGLIPANQASSMTTQLDKIDAAVRRGRCAGVDKQVATLQSQVNALSRKVNAQLRSQLQKGVQNLNDIAFAQCSDNAQATQTKQTQTQTTPTETTQTETVTTQTQTVTTPPETTQTVPPETQTTTIPPTTTPTTPDTGGGVGIPDNGTGGTDTSGGAGGATPIP